MAVTRTIRVIRTWDAEVGAEYGDTDEDLKAKVTEEYLDATAPDQEARVILEHAASEFDTLAEYQAANPAPEEDPS